MLEWIYDALAGIGYHHPLHPPVTHIPVGLVMGAFLFGLAAWVFNRESLAQTARHCIILAFLSAPVAALFGLMDWQHLYGGAWLTPIRIKLALAGVLVALLALAWAASRRQNKALGRRLIVYTACLASVTVLGFFGGELIYGPGKHTTALEDPLVEQGAQLFAESCAMCHYTDSTETKVGPGLEKLFQRKTLPASQKPVTAEAIAAQLKTPYENMPAFPDLTEEEIASLVAYLKTL